jgi:hypothetical protein
MFNNLYLKLKTKEDNKILIAHRELAVIASF